MNFKNISDEELVAFLQLEENHRYFSILMERYDQYILKKCVSFLNHKETAKDLAQEIRIKVFLQLNSFRKDSKFATWLYSIIYHTCIDYLRKTRKNTHLILTEKLKDELTEEIDEQENINKEALLSILPELMEELQYDEKLLLLLKYKEKNSIKTIKDTLGLSEGTIKMRLLRAKTKLNKLYQLKLQSTNEPIK